MIILDAKVICEPLRPRLTARVVSWLDAQVVETLYLTTISLAEVRYGIACLPRADAGTSCTTGSNKSPLKARVSFRVATAFTELAAPI